MQTMLLDIIKKLEEAANEANPAKAESVLWLDDERFTEIEDFIPEPMGGQGVRKIHDWIKQNGCSGDNMHFRDIKGYSLSDEIAYATALQDLNFDEPTTSRVSFLFLKKNDEWGIIHAHYSTMSPG